jgi:hypothetical protein
MVKSLPKVTVELAEGDKGAGGGDAADDGRERDGGEPHAVEQLGAVRRVREEVA